MRISRRTSLLWVSRSKVSCTPWPIDRLAASTKLPKTTPKVVSSVRNFCCHMAASGNANKSPKRTAAPRSNDSGYHLPVLEPHDAIGARAGQVFVVGDEHQRRCTLGQVISDQRHHFAGRRTVQI